MTLEQTTKRVLAINNRLKAKGFNYKDIDEFWANLFRLSPKIEAVGLNDVKVCTGCGHLNIEPINSTFLACCPDSNYIPIIETKIEVEPDIICPDCKQEVLENRETGELYCLGCKNSKPTEMSLYQCPYCSSFNIDIDFATGGYCNDCKKKF